MLKALAQQEKQATRMRQRDTHAGPRDDADLEMDALLAQEAAQFGCVPPGTPLTIPVAASFTTLVGGDPSGILVPP